MILGPLAEAQLRNAVSIGEGSDMVFLQRPMSVAMIVIILGVIALPPLARLIARGRRSAAG
jgi:putative tricarboxylic transport membrane protein